MVSKSVGEVYELPSEILEVITYNIERVSLHFFVFFQALLCPGAPPVIPIPKRP